MTELRDIIEVKKGYIQDAPREYGVNAIVNAANPTLMGSDSNVDGSIHQAEAHLQKRQGALKQKIKEEVDSAPNMEDKIIRCKRGEVVVTGKHFLCEYILHTVGPENDKEGRRPKVCSSSRIRLLESCYKNIIQEAVKKREIKRLAVPVISAGNYKMPFELAFKVGLTTMYNTLLEMKQKDREFFEYMGLEKIYFIIPDGMDGHFETAEVILKEYRRLFYRERRVVAQGSLECQLQFLKEICLYDERRGYFSVARSLRIVLVCIRLVLSFPFTYAKDWIGKKDWVIRRRIVEYSAIIKMILPMLGYFIVKRSSGKGASYGIGILAVYCLLDTVTYLLTLIILADIQKPSANIIRSLILLCVNYIEVSMDFSIIYFIKHYGDVLFRNTLETGILGAELGVPMKDWLDYGIHYLDQGIKFFFLTLAFGYFANHLHQRKFRQIEDVI